MHPRRSHPKSRRGCSLCKQRRVKCDEAGPPCGHCKFRGTRCEYPGHGTSTSTGTITRLPDPSPPRSEHSNSISSSLTPEPPSFPTSDHMLELKLVHYYTVQTYKSLTTEAVGDSEVWQVDVPQLALKHDFLLNAICALAAFEIANSGGVDQQRYITAGLEYQGRALSKSQVLLSDMSAEVATAMFFFSLILMTLALGSSRFVLDRGCNGMIQNTITHVELLRGLGAMGKNYPNDPYLVSVTEKVQPLKDLPKISLDARTNNLLHRLRKANEDRKYGGKGEHGEAVDIHAEGCSRAIYWLEQCFERCREDDFSIGYYIGWPALPGDDYLAALRSEDRLALLILTMWAAAVNRLGNTAWWARGFGASLVNEIAEIMASDVDNLVLQVFDWARQKLSETSP